MIDKKIKLTVLGFSFNQTQSGTYGLVLAEEDGLRRLMIIVGTPEAQSIAFKLQDTEPPRPLTHDLFYSFMQSLDIKLKEVFIYKYENGVFFSTLIFEQNNKEVFLESRTSDAIGIALRSNSPIYTTQEIMKELAIVVSNTNEDQDSEDDEVEMVGGHDSTEYMDTYANLSIKELKSMLQDAIEKEDYELALVLKEKIDRKSI